MTTQIVWVHIVKVIDDITHALLQDSEGKWVEYVGELQSLALERAVGTGSLVYKQESQALFYQVSTNEVKGVVDYHTQDELLVVLREYIQE